MSATIGNLPELASFLDADVYQKDFRPVELREFIKCGSDLVEIKKDADCIENTFAMERTISFNVREHLVKTICQNSHHHKTITTINSVQFLI